MIDILIIIAVILGIIVVFLGFILWKFVRFINKNMYSWQPKHDSDIIFKEDEDELCN